MLFYDEASFGELNPREINKTADLINLYIEKDTVANLNVNKSESKNLIIESQ